MKKIIFGFILGGIIFGSIGIYATTLYKANDISYEPTDISWEVSNVEEALNDLYKKNSNLKGNIIGRGNSGGFTFTADYDNVYVITDRGISNSPSYSGAGALEILSQKTAPSNYFTLYKVSNVAKNDTMSFGYHFTIFE